MHEGVLQGQITRVSHDGARANLYFTEAVRDSLTGGKSDPQLLQALYAGADASMNIPKGEAYQTELKELQESQGFDLRYEPPNEWGGQILSWVIFLGLMVVVWMFLMRRLGGGAPGGGQIFNIDKSIVHLIPSLPKNFEIKIFWLFFVGKKIVHYRRKYQPNPTTFIV